MKLLYCLPLIIFFSCSETGDVNPQADQDLPTDIEDLEELLSTDIDDFRKLEVYAKLGKLLKNSDIEKAQTYLEKQLSLSREVDNKEFEGRAYHGKGLILRRAGNYKEALKSYLHAVDLFEEERLFSRLADDLNNIGFIFLMVEGYEEAIAYFDKVQRFYAESKDYKYQVIALLNLGLCHSKKKDPDFLTSRKLYEQAINLQVEVDPFDYRQLNQAYNLLGWLFFDEKDYRTAISHYKTSVQHASSVNNGSDLLANAYHNLAEAYMNLGDDFYDEANEWIEKADGLTDADSHNADFMVRRLNIAGELKQRQGNHTEALSLFEQAIEMADKDNYNDPLKNTLNLISKSHMAIVRKGGKIDYEKIFAIEELEERQERLRVKFNDSLDKQALKEALKKEVDAYYTEVRQAKIDSDNWVIIKSVATLFLILLVALVALYRVAQKQKKELMINEGEREVILQVLRNP